MASFNATVDSYRTMLTNVDAGRFELTNENFDLGTPASAGQYAGADIAYDKLLDQLAKRKFAEIPPDLRENILVYYRGRKAPDSKSNPKVAADWIRLQLEREQLEQIGLPTP
jgi:hypothetical protein